VRRAAAGRFDGGAVPACPLLGEFGCGWRVVVSTGTGVAFVPGFFGQKPMQPVTHDGWQAVGEEQSENDQTLGHLGLTQGRSQKKRPTFA
jgi:hypothetical protein